MDGGEIGASFWQDEGNEQEEEKREYDIEILEILKCRQ